jgi:hypothetical protein
MRYKEAVLRCFLFAVIALFSGIRPLSANHTLTCASPNAGFWTCHCNGAVIQGWQCTWPTGGWVNDGSMTEEYGSAQECEEAAEECNGPLR